MHEINESQIFNRASDDIWGSDTSIECLASPPKKKKLVAKNANWICAKDLENSSRSINKLQIRRKKKTIRLPTPSCFSDDSDFA